MLKIPSTALRASYVVNIIGMIVPYGLAASSWVTIAKGPSMGTMVPFIGPLFFFTLGLYRSYMVIRFITTLSSAPLSGIATLIRAISTFLIYIGAFATLLSWVARPIMNTLMTSRTESGVEFFVVGMYLSTITGAGLIGLVLFEFSRLLTFENIARERHAAQKST